MQRNKGGLFIDLDGTLADSLAQMRNIYYKFLAQFGKTGNDQEFDNLNGPPLSTVVSALSQIHSLDFSNDYLQKYYQDLIKKFYFDILPKKGALELLQQAKALGMPITIVTSNSSRLAENWVLSAGLDTYIESIVGDEDVIEGKPHPEPYLLALKRSNCDPIASIALEDSIRGAESALAAGIKTFLIDSLESQDSKNQLFKVVDIYSLTKFLSINTGG